VFITFFFFKLPLFVFSCYFKIATMIFLIFQRSIKHKLAISGYFQHLQTKHTWNSSESFLDHARLIRAKNPKEILKCLRNILSFIKTIWCIHHIFFSLSPHTANKNDSNKSRSWPYSTKCSRENSIIIANVFVLIFIFITYISPHRHIMLVKRHII
jgi:hypothetical protein